MTHDSAQLSVRENVATTQKNAKVMFFLDFEKKTLKKRKNVPIVSHYSQATQLQEVITGKSR